MGRCGEPQWAELTVQGVAPNSHSNLFPGRGEGGERRPPRPPELTLQATGRAQAEPQWAEPDSAAAGPVPPHQPHEPGAALRFSSVHFPAAAPPVAPPSPSPPLRSSPGPPPPPPLWSSRALSASVLLWSGCASSQEVRRVGEAAVMRWKDAPQGQSGIPPCQTLVHTHWVRGSKSRAPSGYESQVPHLGTAGSQPLEFRDSARQCLRDKQVGHLNPCSISLAKEALEEREAWGGRCKQRGTRKTYLVTSQYSPRTGVQGCPPPVSNPTFYPPTQSFHSSVPLMHPQSIHY